MTKKDKGPCIVCGKRTSWNLRDHHELGDEGFVCKDHQCPECDRFGQQAYYPDDYDPFGICRTCDGKGFVGSEARLVRGDFSLVQALKLAPGVHVRITGDEEEVTGLLIGLSVSVVMRNAAFFVKRPKVEHPMTITLLTEDDALMQVPITEKHTVTAFWRST